jgi:hypothetical protein
MELILVKMNEEQHPPKFFPNNILFIAVFVCEAAVNFSNSVRKTFEEHNFGIEFKRIIQVFLQDMANIMFNMKIRKFVNKIHKQVTFLGGGGGGEGVDIQSL